jgi:hypothetical protein
LIGSRCEDHPPPPIFVTISQQEKSNLEDDELINFSSPGFDAVSPQVVTIGDENNFAGADGNKNLLIDDMVAAEEAKTNPIVYPANVNQKEAIDNNYACDEKEVVACDAGAEKAVDNNVGEVSTSGDSKKGSMMYGNLGVYVPWFLADKSQGHNLIDLPSSFSSSIYK